MITILRPWLKNFHSRQFCLFFSNQSRPPSLVLTTKLCEDLSKLNKAKLFCYVYCSNSYYYLHNNIFCLLFYMCEYVLEQKPICKFCRSPAHSTEGKKEKAATDDRSDSPGFALFIT
jgi:hypothetical protein